MVLRRCYNGWNWFLCSQMTLAASGPSITHFDSSSPVIIVFPTLYLVYDKLLCTSNSTRVNQLNSHDRNLEHKPLVNKLNSHLINV